MHIHSPSPRIFKAVLYGGASHGALLHRVSHQIHPWSNPLGQTYHFRSWIITSRLQIALLTFQGPKPPQKLSAFTAEVRSLLSDPEIFAGLKKNLYRHPTTTQPSKTQP